MSPPLVISRPTLWEAVIATCAAFLGAKPLPITYIIDGPIHSGFIQDMSDIAVERVGDPSPPRHMVITDTRRTYVPPSSHGTRRATGLPRLWLPLRSRG